MGGRVVVTGMGALSPLGLDVPTLWQGVREARSGIAPITLCEVSNLSSRIAGEVKGFDPQSYMDRKEVRRTDRFVHLVIAATAEALRSAELSITPGNADEIGAIIGSAFGGIGVLFREVSTFLDRGPSRVSPFLATAMITSMAAGQVAISYGLRGPNFCTSSACATGAHAIGEAVETIRRGAAKVIIAGGSEAPITPVCIASLANAGALSTRNDTPTTASRPFDATRDGFVLAEGGAVLVLEDLEFALSRGARILAEVAGYGLSADAHHISHPSDGGEGALRAMQLALKHADLTPSDLDYINAHGTSTLTGDVAESQAIRTLLGERASQVPVSSSKSQFGHTLGAAGAIEAIICILAIQNDLLPPTINYHTPDPQCDLDYVPNVARPSRIDVAMNNSFGIGGHNASLVFRRYTD